MIQNDHISSLISKYITSTLSLEDEKCLNEWLKDPYNKFQFDRIVDLETIYENLEDFDYFHSNQQWDKLNDKIMPQRQIGRWLAYVATILLPIGVVGYLFFLDKDIETTQVETISELVVKSDDVLLEFDNGEQYVFNYEDTLITTSQGQLKIDSTSLSFQNNTKQVSSKLEYNTLTIPKGMQYQLSLSDGTQVWLNAHTKFKYPVVFTGKQRDVFLTDGEAFFEVTKNKEKPFVVHLDKEDVTVLGTSFNVKAYKNEATHQITLEEGSVLVKNDKNVVKLIPNQQVIICKSKQNLMVKNVDASMYSAWRNKMFIYRNVRLEQIMMDLERYYDLKIFYENQALQDEMFSLSIDVRDDFQDIIEMMQTTGTVNFSMKGNVLVIKK